MDNRKRIIWIASLLLILFPVLNYIIATNVKGNFLEIWLTFITLYSLIAFIPILLLFIYLNSLYNEKYWKRKLNIIASLILLSWVLYIFYKLDEFV